MSEFLSPTDFIHEALTQLNLEGRVKYGGRSVTGSDEWLDMVMNVFKERAAIKTFFINYQSINSHLSESELEQSFTILLDRWLTSQFEFCLSENGCNKFLQLQPNYYFKVSRDDRGHIVTPTDISQFGDLSARYTEENPRVGAGLQQIYKQLADQGGNRQFWTGIISPTEEYQGYGSQTDVINLMLVSGGSQGKAMVIGKYLVLNQVLEGTERRFIHNLFFKLQHKSLSELNLGDIPTDKLLTHQDLNHLPEHQRLIIDPNSFTHSEFSEDPLFSFTLKLNEIFKQKFHKELISARDIEMYPIIKNLVQEYLPALKYALIYGQDKDSYYQVLRQMIYHCQALWAKNQHRDLPKNSYYHYDYGSDDFAYEHLHLLTQGVIMAGFEFAPGDNQWDTDSVFSYLTPYTTSYSIDYSQPIGFEVQHKCRRHGKYEGDECPDCKRIAKEN